MLVPWKLHLKKHTQVSLNVFFSPQENPCIYRGPQVPPLVIGRVPPRGRNEEKPWGLCLEALMEYQPFESETVEQVTMGSWCPASCEKREKKHPENMAGWKITMLNRRYIFKWLFFHCHVSFLGRKSQFVCAFVGVCKFAEWWWLSDDCFLWLFNCMKAPGGGKMGGFVKLNIFWQATMTMEPIKHSHRCSLQIWTWCYHYMFHPLKYVDWNLASDGIKPIAAHKQDFRRVREPIPTCGDSHGIYVGEWRVLW